MSVWSIVFRAWWTHVRMYVCMFYDTSSISEASSTKVQRILIDPVFVTYCQGPMLRLIG